MTDVGVLEDASLVRLSEQGRDDSLPEEGIFIGHAEQRAESFSQSEKTLSGSVDSVVYDINRARCHKQIVGARCGGLLW